VRRAFAIAMVLAFGAGCGGAVQLPPPPPSPRPVIWPSSLRLEQGAETPDAPFRDRVPESGPPVAYAPPKV